MKSELEQKSVDLLNWLEQTIKTTTESGAEQIPLFIKELLEYNYWMSLSFFIISLIAFILSICATYKFVRWAIKNDEDESLACSLVSTIPIVLSIVAICNNMEWLMIQLAPRVYLLEYVKEMIKH